MSEIKEKEYKRKNFKNYESEIETLSMTSDVYDIAIESLERTKSRPPVYSNDQEGLERFKTMTLEYMKEIRKRNVEAENSKRMRLIPSVEMWAAYLGITRQTIHTYEHNYNAEYKEFIQQFKNVIAAVKKELAENGKIPPVIHIFDFVNNHSYLNTNNVTVNTTTSTDNSSFILPSERVAALLKSDNQEQETQKKTDIFLDDEPLPYLD